MKSRVHVIVSVLALALAALPWAADLAGAVPLAEPRLCDGGTLAQPSRSAGLAQPLLLAAAPSMVSYQGQVSLGGSPFDGKGIFKFAIVDAKVTTSYWSNDGSSEAGEEPDLPVDLVVTNGLFNVLLGDTSLTNMTEPLGAAVFADPECYLRVWFSEDGETFQQLSPDRRIAAVPYALQAEEAANADRIDGQHAADLMVPSGAVVLGFRDDPRLTAAGYVALGPSVELWRSTSTTNAPTGRDNHTAVWTGSEMIIWGGTGYSPQYKNDGGRYDPGTDAWTPTTTTGAPSGRTLHTAVWTGSEMIVWGGYGAGDLNTGGRYDPGTDTWVPTTTTNAPTGRHNHSAVWTGSEMIVWGGWGGTSALSDGGRYDPDTDSWTNIATIGAPSARTWHTAVWTGSEMIVWGGLETFWNGLDSGGRYDPATNTWADLPAFNLPDARYHHTAVWTGSEMIVWGGDNAGTLNSGGRCEPAGPTWKPTTISDAPSARRWHTAVWTGSEMVVWGGGELFEKNNGGRYDAATDSWTPVATTSAPSARYDHTAVWTGSEMIVWGGSGYLQSGGRLCRLHLYQKP